MSSLLYQTLVNIVPSLNAVSRRSGTDGWQLLWEARATLGTPSNRPGLHFEIDGGVRAERLTGPGGGNAFRFAVGAGPAVAIALAQGRGRRLLPSWDQLISLMVDELVVKHRSAAQDLANRDAGDSEKGPNPNTLETLGRARILTGPGIEPCVEFSIGHRIRVHPDPPDRTGVALYAPGELPPVAETGSWIRQGSAEPLTHDCVERVVLSSEVAGWAAHELGHAALEKAVRRPDQLGIQLTDDPRRAPWPVGFQFDDHGSAARQADIGLGVEAPYRRPSVRERAAPALSFTSLKVTGDHRCTRRDLDPGTIFVDSARAGRFDSATGIIVLEARRFYRIKKDGTLGDTGHSGLVMLNERSWQRVIEVADEPQAKPEPALCTRAGAVNAVMVGAPTIVLEPARLIPLNDNRDGGNQGY